MDHIIKLENALTKKIINIGIHNYSHGSFEELFYLIEELANELFVTCSYTIKNSSIDSEYIHIILKKANHKHSLENTLSVLLYIQHFIISDIEVSLLH